PTLASPPPHLLCLPTPPPTPHRRTSSPRRHSPRRAPRSAGNWVAAQAWLRALSLLRVVAPEMAGARIERGRAVTVRRLFDEVQWAVEGRAAGGAGDQRQMGAHEECPPGD